MDKIINELSEKLEKVIRQTVEDYLDNGETEIAIVKELTRSNYLDGLRLTAVVYDESCPAIAMLIGDDCSNVVPLEKVFDSLFRIHEDSDEDFIEPEALRAYADFGERMHDYCSEQIPIAEEAKKIREQEKN